MFTWNAIYIFRLISDSENKEIDILLLKHLSKWHKFCIFFFFFKWRNGILYILSHRKEVNIRWFVFRKHGKSKDNAFSLSYRRQLKRHIASLIKNSEASDKRQVISSTSKTNRAMQVQIYIKIEEYFFFLLLAILNFFFFTKVEIASLVNFFFDKSRVKAVVRITIQVGSMKIQGYEDF